MAHDERHDLQGAATLWTSATQRPTADEPWTGHLAFHNQPPPVPTVPLTQRDGVDLGSNRTQVLVTKTRAGFQLFIDGVAVTPVAPAPGEIPVATIKRFHGPFRSPDTGKTVIGPVSVAIMTETGQRKPSVAFAKILQQTTIDHRVTQDDVVQTVELTSGNEQEPTVPVVSLPFPCRFTESPYIIIDDVYSLRLYQARKLYQSLIPIFVGVLRFVYAVVVSRAPVAVAQAQPTIVQGVYDSIFGPTAPAAAAAAGAPAPLSLMERIEALLTVWFPNIFNDPLTATVGTQRVNLLQRIPLFFGAGNRVLRSAESVAVLSWLLTFMRFTRLATLLDRENIALFRTGMGIKDAPGGLGGNALDPDEDVAVDARNTLVGKVATALLSMGTSDAPPRNRRKFTMRGLAQTLHHLMSIDEDDGSAFGRTVRKRYKNEAVLADFLMEPEAGVLQTLGEFFNRMLSKFGLGLFQAQDDRGNQPRGLFFAAVGPADLSGLDTQLLRKSHVGTAIEIHIVDPGTRGGFRVRLVAEEEIAFQAGFHASGLAEDMDLLEDAMLRFETVHCDPNSRTMSTKQLCLASSHNTRCLRSIGDVHGPSGDSTGCAWPRLCLSTLCKL